MKKTIFITGASSGIGKETAKFFAKKEWNVAATMRSPENEDELNAFPQIKIYRLDVTQPEDIETAMKAATSDFPTIDVLLNNAGYGAVGAFEKASRKEIRAQFEVNVFGLMDLTHAFIPLFRKQGHGMIINVSSVSGQVTSPLYSMYNASKYAVEGFSESLQYELKQFNIQVKNIQPGPVKSDFRGRSLKLFRNENVTGYEPLEKAILSGMEERNKTAAHPLLVAETIHKAITDGKDKLRYPVGNQAKILLKVRKYLPSSWFNKLVYKKQVQSKSGS